VSQGEDVFVIESDGEIDAVRFLGDRFSGLDHLQQLDRGLTEAVDRREQPKMLFDFQDVKFVTSGLLGLLAAISVKVHKRLGRVCACCLDENLDDLFRRVNLDKLLEVHAARDEALAALQ